MRSIILCFLIGSVTFALGQPEDSPTDFLSKDFHLDRRQKLREKLPPNSVAVFFSNATRNRSNDVDYEFHQDPDFYYLTGYKEPHSLLLVFKDRQNIANGTSYNEIIFVQPRNVLREMWTGRRLGDQGVKEQWGFPLSFNNSEFKRYNIDFSKFDKVLFFDFKNDVRDLPSDSADLYNLIQQFKAKANYQDKESLSVAPEPQKNNLYTRELGSIMDDLRGIKTTEEMKLLRKAVLVSCQAQIEVMKAMKPGMSENGGAGHS